MDSATLPPIPPAKPGAPGPARFLTGAHQALARLCRAAADVAAARRAVALAGKNRTARKTARAAARLAAARLAAAKADALAR